MKNGWKLEGDSDHIKLKRMTKIVFNIKINTSRGVLFAVKINDKKKIMILTSEDQENSSHTIKKVNINQAHMFLGYLSEK
jgi:hypothetical protein